MMRMMTMMTMMMPAELAPDGSMERKSSIGADELRRLQSFQQDLNQRNIGSNEYISQNEYMQIMLLLQKVWPSLTFASTT